MSRMRTGGLATLALTALTSTALITPALVTPAHAAGDRGDPDRSNQRQSMSQAAERSRVERRREGANKPRSAQAKAMQAGLYAMVDSGATGVVARLETPTFTWSGAAGMRDHGVEALAQPQARFRVASNSKTMVATLVMQEVQRGNWELDMPVAKVMPGLFPKHQKVTFRQLLSHTSGIPNGTAELLASQMSDPTSQKQLLAAISRDYKPQQHIDAVNAAKWTRPGKFVYSNAGFVALGMLLEKQNGRSLNKLLQERIFTPAGMKETYFADEPGLRAPALQEDGWMGGTTWMELDGFDPDFFGAAGAVVSTTEDLNDFTSALISGKLLDRHLVRLMMTPASTGLGGYGLGLYRLPDPCAAEGSGKFLYGHDGASLGTLSVMMVSEDGKRRYSLAGTGRDNTSLKGRWQLDQALVPIFKASCSAG